MFIIIVLDDDILKKIINVLFEYLSLIHIWENNGKIFNKRQPSL